MMLWCRTELTLFLLLNCLQNVANSSVIIAENTNVWRFNIFHKNGSCAVCHPGLILWTWFSEETTKKSKRTFTQTVIYFDSLKSDWTFKLKRKFHNKVKKRDHTAFYTITQIVFTKKHVMQATFINNEQKCENMQHIRVEIFAQYFIKLQTYLSTVRLNVASVVPTFLTSKTRICACFTGPAGKTISSGKSRIARAPIAWIGTINFSLSVMQITSWT